MKRVYFDNAATTPVSEEVVEVMADALRNKFGNPSSIHAEGRAARAAVEQARKKVAQYLGASIGEIFFTSCGTESNNMVLKNAVRDLGVQRIISTKTEHHCVLHSLDSIGLNGDCEIVYVDQDTRGRVDLSQIESLFGQGGEKTMVSLMHANNEIGTMIDLAEVGEMCREHGALFHSDTVQTIGYYPIDVSRMHINFLSGSAHKFHGPKGAGFVYINGENKLKPFLDGGGQERNMRGGTENIAGILGLAKALELACENMEQRRSHIELLRGYLKERLLENFEDLHFNGDHDGAAHYKLLSVAFPPSPKADLLLLNLDIAGISVSGGSACSSGADAGSHVIEALHGDPDRKTIRFSFSHYNTQEEVDFVIGKLKEILPVSIQL
jgi:cysteine desulfurase